GARAGGGRGEVEGESAGGPPRQGAIRAILEEPAGPAHGDGRLQSRGSRGGANAEGESEAAPRHHGPRDPVALTTETQHAWSEGGDAGDRVGRHGHAAR